MFPPPIKAWQEAGLLDWVNAQKDSKGRNILNKLAFDGIMGKRHIKNLTKRSLEPLFVPDRNGICAVLSYYEFFFQLSEENTNSGSEASPWLITLMERFKITRFGSEKITFADWCVTCCQNDSGIRELQKNLREMQKSPLQKYREVFQFTRDANGFGDFSRNEYFARLTRGRNIGTDLWRTFTDSKYSLRFKLKPEEFLEAALNVAANKDEKILFVETKGEHGRIDTIPGDPLYKDFWGLGRSTRSSAHSKAKTVESLDKFS